VLALALLISLALFIQKVVYKRALEKRPGHGVRDEDVNSITAWMDARPARRPAPISTASSAPDGKDSSER
jgi:hypothetical protein